MEKIDNEYYVSPEVAKLLEKAGFDWRCKKCYNKGVLFDMESDEIREQCPQHSSYDVLAPVLDVAQRWLREVMKIEVFVEPFIGFYKYVVEELKDNGIYSNGRGESYEEALEAGIKKALEIILKK